MGQVKCALKRALKCESWRLGLMRLTPYSKAEEGELLEARRM